MSTSDEQIETLRRKLQAYRALQELGEDHTAEIKSLEAELYNLLQTQPTSDPGDKERPRDGNMVGRDKIVTGGDRSVVIGGHVSSSMIIAGDGNMITSTSMTNLFAPIYRQIAESARSAREKADLTAEVQEIESAIARPSVDESWLARRLRNLKRMAPDIADVALASLSGPGAVISEAVRKVAARVRAEQT